MIAREKAPRFLNLFVIKLPVTGVASIAHRISGVLLFLAVPLLAWGFGRSIETSAGFDRIVEALDSRLLKFLAAMLVWSLAQHLFTGVRHLLLDIGLGIDLRAARLSAWASNLAALAVALVWLVTVL